MARSIYEPADIDTTMALRQASATQESFINFQTIRTLSGSPDSSFSFGPRAARPSGGTLGDRYFANNIGTRGGWLYYWTGTAWAAVAGWASGTNAARAAITPNATENGFWFFTTDTGKFWQVEGGAWVDRTPATGSGVLSVATKTADYTLTDADDVILVDCTAGPVTIALHPVASALKKVYYTKKIDASADSMRLDANASETIDGGLTLSTSVRYSSYSLFPNGSEWSIL